MKTYNVVLPIAGHIYVQVEANSEKEAIAAAFDSPDLVAENIESWEVLQKFNSGNVCHCPSPWEASAELALEDDAE